MWMGTPTANASSSSSSSSSSSLHYAAAHRCWGLHPCCETLLIRLTGYGHAANERRGSDMHDEAGKCLEHHDHVALRPRGSMCWCSKRYNLQHRIVFIVAGLILCAIEHRTCGEGRHTAVCLCHRVQVCVCGHTCKGNVAQRKT